MKWLVVLLLALTQLGWAGERRLVFLRKTPLGYLAEVSPRFDYTTYLSRSYRVQGADSAVLDAVSSAEGLPVRLYGEYRGDQVRVPRPAVGQPPPVLPVASGTSLWRGRVHGRVLSKLPARVVVETGPGESLEASLEFENPGEAEEWAIYSERGDFSLECTCLGTRLVDLRFAPWAPPRQSGSYRVLLQLSETFLNRVAEEYLAGHKPLFGWADPKGVTGFQVREMGVTTLNCAAGEVRLYGRLDGRVMGLALVEGEWEARARPAFQGSHLNTPLVADSLQLRITRPFFMGVPGLWSEGLRVMLSLALAQGLRLPVPELYRKDLVASGLLEEAQLDGFGLWTVSTGDRRTSLLVAAAPQGPGTQDLLQSRLARNAHYAVALAPEAVNAALTRMVPPLLPLRRPIPPELQLNSQVFIFRLKLREAEIPELDLGFEAGRFVVRTALVVVHWTLGPLSGVEPAARVAGTARVFGEGSPLKLRVDPDITSLQVLSSHIQEQSPEEQVALREQIVRSLRGTTLDLPLPVQVAVPDLSSKAVLELVGVDSPDRDLVLQGRLGPRVTTQAFESGSTGACR